MLSPFPFYVCRKCNRILPIVSFKPIECECRSQISTITDVDQVLIRYLSSSLIKFIESNSWLEHGVAHLLRQKNVDVLVGREVLGHSGNWHEIDVIGESHSQNYRVFCECKNCDLKVAHIFVFFGKMSDVGCTRGYVFTTSAQIPTPIIRLARSKNISIVADVLKRPNAALLNELSDL
jgi:hypothetical protein